MPIKELKLDLMPLIKKMEIFTKKKIQSGLTGRYASAFKGRGLEFEGYGPYSITEDASTIDWKASLRSDEILVKKFVVERSLYTFFLLDVSNSMLFASINKLKAEYAAEFVAVLSFAILQAGDNVGVAMFTDRIEKEVRPNMGRKQYFEIIRALSNPQFYGGKYDLEFVLKYALNSLKRRSVVIIVSDFLGLKGNWKRWLRIATEKFDVIAMIIRDPRDFVIPKNTGPIVIADPYSKQELLINPREVADSFEETAKKRYRELIDTFKDMRIDHLTLMTNEDFVGKITKFFVRREQMKRR